MRQQIKRKLYIIQNMKSRLQKQQSGFESINKQLPTSRDVGTLTPVHIEDIIKDKNLDYLQSLGELVERMPADPIWYQYENADNKCKFLQVYQIAICYSRNTQAIYNGVLQQIDKQFKQKKQKVEKLKAQILDHKDKTQRMKKNYRKEKLHKERQKALNYERNLLAMRDKMLLQKKQLQLKNQQKMKEERKKQREAQSEDKTHQNPFNHIQRHPHQFYPPPQPYPYYPYPPPPPNYYPQQQYDPLMHQHHLNLQPQPFIHMPQNSQQLPQPQSREQLAKIVQPAGNGKKVQFQTLKRSDPGANQFSFGEVDSSSSNKQKQDPNLKQSTKSKDGNRGSNKSWTLRNSDAIRQSNAESQKDDVVQDLSGLGATTQRKLDDGSKLSRKSSDMSDADINSFMDVQLKTQSKGDLNGPDLKDRLVKKTVSIIESIKSDQDQKKKSQPKKQLPKTQEVTNYSNNMSVKITKQKQRPPSLIQSVDTSRTGYLDQSNQGERHKPIQGLGAKLDNRIRLKASSNLGKSAHSFDDTQSKYQSKIQDDEAGQYHDDFQVEVDQEEEKKTRVMVNVDSSVSSPEKSKILQFIPLLKNYFILKDQATGMAESRAVSSDFGSLKQFSVKFIGNQKKKTNENKSRFVDDQDIFDLIDIPMQSRIAKPSMLKQSTQRKSAIHSKIHKSHNPKKKSKQNLKQHEEEDGELSKDSFIKNSNFDSFKSRNAPPKYENTLTVPIPQIPKSSLDDRLSISLTHSTVIKQQLQQEQGSSKNQKLDLKNGDLLSIIQQSQNQSLNTQQYNPNKQILNLIDRKYKQKGKAEFNKDLITKEIQTLSKERGEDLTWETIVQAFQQLSQKKQEEVNKLIKDRMNAKGNKQTSRQSSGVKRPPSNRIQTIQQKKQEEDDLSYSVSLLQNPPLLPKKQAQKKTISQKSQPDKIQTKSASEKQTGMATKYIRQQSKQGHNSNTRMLDRLLETSKFDQDDLMGNDIKNNFPKKNPVNSSHNHQDDEEVEVEQSENF